MTIKVAKQSSAAKDVGTPKAASLKKTTIMLGAGIKRYVVADGNQTTGGKLYEAGVEYPVTAEERKRMFQFKDDNGVRVFYDAEIIREQMKAASARRRQQRAAAGDEDAQREIEQDLIDTGARRTSDDAGAMSLTDDNGDAVGVVA